MQLSAGSFQFPANSTAISRVGQVYRPYGVPLYTDWNWTITCFLKSDATTPAARQADFSGQEQSIRTLTHTSNLDWVLSDDNHTPTDLSLRYRETIFTETGYSGITCTTFGSLKDRGPEFAGQREITFTLNAKCPIISLNSIVISFEETVSFDWSRPVGKAWVGMTGAKGITIARPGRPWRATQSGSAVGLLKHPEYKGPDGCAEFLWKASPDILIQSVQTTKGSAKIRNGDALMEFPISWSYQYEGTERFDKKPTRWPNGAA